MIFKQWIQGELERIEAALTDRPEPDDWEVEGEEVARHKGRREALERAAVVYRSEQTRKGNEDNLKAVEAALGDVVRYCLETKRDIQGGKSRDIVDYGMGKGAAQSLDKVVEYIRRQPTGAKAVADATKRDHFSPTRDPGKSIAPPKSVKERARNRIKRIEKLESHVEQLSSELEELRQMYRKQTRSVLDAAALLGEVVRAAREDAGNMGADALFSVAERIKQYIEASELELGEGQK